MQNINDMIYLYKILYSFMYVSNMYNAPNHIFNKQINMKRYLYIGEFAKQIDIMIYKHEIIDSTTRCFNFFGKQSAMTIWYAERTAKADC